MLGVLGGVKNHRFIIEVFRELHMLKGGVKTCSGGRGTIATRYKTTG